MNLNVCLLLCLMSNINNWCATQEIVSQDNKLDENGYSFSYDTSDGQHREEIGTITDAEKENSILSVTGAFSYTGPDGKLYQVTYEANENGYRPKFTSGASGVPKASVRAGTGARVGEDIVPYLGSAAQASLIGGGIG